MSLDKDQPVDLDWGEITPLDIAMNQFDLSAHVSEDMFANKIAFISLLNFPVYSLAEKTALGGGWSRKQWAFARAAGSNSTRIPADVNQKVSALMADAGRYISDYNIFMGSLVDGNMKTLFPADMKLITHWGIRDELKARYGDPQGLPKQEMIYQVMQRIIRQEIPAVMVNSGKYQWNPMSNKVFEKGREIASAREADVRYKTFLDTFQAMRLVDAYSPLYPDHISRSFDIGREIPEKEVEAMFRELLASPQVGKVAALIRKRLGRKLLPFDIWYPGLRSDSTVPEEELDKIVQKKYPTAAAFEKDLPSILEKLGFTPENAAFIAARIQVDPARGSGHEAPTASRKFKARLRTRVAPGGMNYKGYNIAVHELGHAVECVLDLYKIDYYSLAGVPNGAFTEAFAFIFQDRDLELLGIPAKDPRQKELKVLDTFWSAYEIMAVSLVDMQAWHWLYGHPQATPQQLKEAVIAIAKGIWNQYFAPVFGDSRPGHPGRVFAHDRLHPLPAPLRHRQCHPVPDRGLPARQSPGPGNGAHVPGRQYHAPGMDEERRGLGNFGQTPAQGRGPRPGYRQKVIQKYLAGTDVLQRYLPCRERSVIDVGCGNGDTVRWLAGQGARVTGLDGPDMLAKARSRPAAGGETYIEAGAQKLPFADASADIILYQASFHHVPVDAMAAAAAECRRVLKNGGRAVFIEPVYRVGAYSEITRLVEEEEEAQKEAYAAIIALAASGLAMNKEEFFYLERSFADYVRLLEFFVADAALRAAVLGRARMITERFSAAAGLDFGDFRYRSICRLNLLVKDGS